MYQVKVYNRQTNEVIMESDTFQTLPEADEMLSRIGSGEGYYSIVFKLDAVWSDLVPAQSSVPRSPPTRAGGGFYYFRRTGILYFRRTGARCLVCGTRCQ